MRIKYRTLLSIFIGCTFIGNGCINTIVSLPVCGSVLTFCTPNDQLMIFFPLLEIPDFGTDPSCTIPLGCGDGDVFPPSDGGIGGNAPDTPDDCC